MFAKIRAALKTEITLTRKADVADLTDALISGTDARLEAAKRALEAYNNGKAL